MPIVNNDEFQDYYKLQMCIVPWKGLWKYNKSFSLLGFETLMSSSGLKYLVPSWGSVKRSSDIFEKR